MNYQQDEARPVLMVLERSSSTSSSHHEARSRLQLISEPTDTDEEPSSIAVDTQFVQAHGEGKYVVLIPVTQASEWPDKRMGLLYENVARRVFEELSGLLQDPRKLALFEKIAPDAAADFFFDHIAVEVKAAPSVHVERHSHSAAHIDGKEEQDPETKIHERSKLRDAYFERLMADKDENLSLADAAARSGMSEVAVNNARKEARLYALIEPSRQRGHRYPRWQFEAQNGRLEQVLAPFKDRYPDCWAIHAFMTQPNYRLGGKLPKEAILNPSMDIEPVVHAASAYITTMLGEGG